MKFIPFKTLIQTLRFKEDNAARRLVAVVDDEEVAFANFAAVSTKEAMDDWKTEVRRAILAQSSTVVLRTACGCEQMKDLFQKEDLHAFLVPLMWTISAMRVLQNSTDADIFKTNRSREFRWERRYHDNGARVMEEVVRP